MSDDDVSNSGEEDQSQDFSDQRDKKRKRPYQTLPQANPKNNIYPSLIVNQSGDLMNGSRMKAKNNTRDIEMSIPSNQANNGERINLNNYQNDYSKMRMMNQNNIDPKRHFMKNLTPSNAKDERLYNKENLENLIRNVMKKYGIQKANFQEIENFINMSMEEYLKNLIENLIKISRVRNLNLNLYSKMAEKNQILKINTFNNSEKSVNPTANDLIFYKDFSIIFTKNMKNVIDTLDLYEELNSCKNRVEKISSFKNKIEHAAEIKEKEKEKSLKNNSQIPKLKTRKRDNQYMKLCKKEVEKTKQKEDKNRQKKESVNTLEFFLDNNKQKESMFNKDSDSNMNESNHLNQQGNNMEIYTKQSEISKSEVLNGNNNVDNNELLLTIYKSHIPTENTKSNPELKRRITLKDLIFYLEDTKRNSVQNFILHKAILKLNQISNN